MRGASVLLLLALLLTMVAGCINADPTPAPVPDEAARFPFEAHRAGALVDAAPLAELGFGAGYNITQHYVGHRGPEPSLGVTSNGDIFFVAMDKVLRSSDHGHTWQVVSTQTSSPTTLDPLLWVDPTTDRVFSDQLYVGCSYMSWSDDQGATWTTNPAACGVPGNDHQKMTTGPYGTQSTAANALRNPVVDYPNVVYYAYNAIAGGRVAMSFDGGLTFPVTSQTFLLDCGDLPVGGLHGRIRADSSGTVYVPARNCGGPIVAKSTDNGFTWTQTEVAPHIGTARYDKNPDLAIDTEDNLYLLWPGEDNLLYFATSTDKGATWSEPVRAAPPGIKTATMPSAVAGDPGRVAYAYYATRDNDSAPDLVPEESLWDLYVTYTLNGLDAEPTFVTYRVNPADDPIQVGPISTNSNDAPSGSRNLLDFIDMVRDADGRFYVAFADGCTEKCKLDDMTTSRDRAGVAALLQDGPSLLDGVGPLAPLP